MRVPIICTVSLADVKRYLASGKSFLICDIETTSLHIGHGRILCIAFTLYDRKDVLVWWPQDLRELQGLTLQNAVFHNAHFDAFWLRAYGAQVHISWDTMMMAHLLNENEPSGLKSLGGALGYQDWAEDTANLEHLPHQQVTEYVAKDALVTKELLKEQRQHIKTQLKPGENPVHVMRRIMLPALLPLHKMETAMMPVRVTAAQKRLARVSAQIDRIEASLTRSMPSQEQWPDWLKRQEPKWGNTNWTKWWLYVYQGAPVLSVGKPTPTWPEGAPSLSKEVLSRLSHPSAQKLIKLSTLRKLSSTFLLPIVERNINGRIPTKFNITGTVTGRISSSSPGKGLPGINSQQIPRVKSVRSIFGERGKLWVECDYSQLELRVAATMANEPTMIKLFKQGVDIHSYMAKKLAKSEEISKEQRTLAKGVNFGFLYGMRASHFANYLRDNYGLIISEKEAKEFREEYFQAFKGLPKWYAQQRKLCLKHGGVPNAFGRFRHLPKVYDEDYWVQENAFRQAINAPVQSTASDFMLISLGRIARSDLLKELGATLITTVHDSVELTAPPSTANEVAKEVKRIMETADDSLPKDYLLRADSTVSKYWGSTPLAEY